MFNSSLVIQIKSNSSVIQILADCPRIITFCYSLESQVIREVEILGDKIHQTPGIDLMRETWSVINQLEYLNGTASVII